MWEDRFAYEDIHNVEVLLPVHGTCMRTCVCMRDWKRVSPWWSGLYRGHII